MSATIESDSNSNRKNAIQYILLHEFGHAYQIGQDFSPIWGVSPEKISMLSTMDFFSFSWRVKDKSFVSRFDKNWSLRSKIRYYAGSSQQMAKSDVLGVYQSLKGTNFPTLYAATNPFDDFAESFSNYIHTQVLNKPWKIEILENGKVKLKVGPCWQEPRCREKNNFLIKILSR